MIWSIYLSCYWNFSSVVLDKKAQKTFTAASSNYPSSGQSVGLVPEVYEEQEGEFEETLKEYVRINILCSP